MLSPILTIALLVLLGCKQQNPEFFESGNGLHGLKAGRSVLVVPKFHMVTNFNGCCAYVVDDTGWVAIGQDGKYLFRPFLFDNFPDALRENRARYVENGLIGFYDSSFTVRVPAKFGFARPFENGYASFCYSCKVSSEGEYYSVSSENWGLMDTSGNIILPPKYDEIAQDENGTITLVEKGDTTKLNGPKEVNGNKEPPK